LYWRSCVALAQRRVLFERGEQTSPCIRGSSIYREAELGPALVFEHDPNAARLDRYLARGQGIFDQRLALIRQLGEAMAYAHGKRIYHRGLAPQSILGATRTPPLRAFKS
jgi:serine/threonine protein kinase